MAVNVLVPSLAALISAASVPDAPLKKLDAVVVSIVDVVVYLLAVDDSKLLPAVSVVAAPVLSSNPAQRCGLVPWALSAIVMLLALRLAGALGTAFIVNVIVSLSFWCMVSGVPVALKSITMLPLPAPV